MKRIKNYLIPSVLILSSVVSLNFISLAKPSTTTTEEQTVSSTISSDAPKAGVQAPEIILSTDPTFSGTTAEFDYHVEDWGNNGADEEWTKADFDDAGSNKSLLLNGEAWTDFTFTLPGVGSNDGELVITKLEAEENYKDNTFKITASDDSNPANQEFTYAIRNFAPDQVDPTLDINDEWTAYDVTAKLSYTISDWGHDYDAEPWETGDIKRTNGVKVTLNGENVPNSQVSFDTNKEVLTITGLEPETEYKDGTLAITVTDVNGDDVAFPEITLPDFTTTNEPEPSGGGGSATVIIVSIILVLLAVAVIAGVGYWLYNSGKNKKTSAK